MTDSDKTSPEAVCACDSRNVAIRESFRLLSRQYQILSFLLIPYPGCEGRHCPREINISLQNTVPTSGFFFHEAGIIFRSQVPTQCGSQWGKPKSFLGSFQTGIFSSKLTRSSEAEYHRITEPFRLQKMLKIIKSKCKLNTTKFTTKTHP